MTHRLALVALALASLTGCPDATPADAGQDAPVLTEEVGLRDTGMPDAHVAVIFDDVMSIDAATDAFFEDAFVVDAFAEDAAPLHDAAAPLRDARGAAPGMCNPEACTPTCFRPIRCVTECGGPVTECGCCACAPGSVDTLECSSSM